MAIPGITQENIHLQPPTKVVPAQKTDSLKPIKPAAQEATQKTDGVAHKALTAQEMPATVPQAVPQAVLAPRKILFSEVPKSYQVKLSQENKKKIFESCQRAKEKLKAKGVDIEITYMLCHNEVRGKKMFEMVAEFLKQLGTMHYIDEKFPRNDSTIACEILQCNCNRKSKNCL